MRAQAPAIGAKDSRCMRFVNDEEAVMPVRDLCQPIDRRTVAVHAVERLGSNPDKTYPAIPAPVPDCIIEGVGVIVCSRNGLRPAKPDPVMDTGVNQFVINDKIAALR